METKKRKSEQYTVVMNMVWAVVAVIINYGMNFLITPYVTNNIGVEAYGFVALATTFTSYVDIISVGLNAFAGRFISIAYHKGDYGKASRFYSSTIAADAVLAVLIFVPSLVAIGSLEKFFRIPGALERDVKLLFLVVLVKYLLTVMRTAFDTAAFIANRLDIAERKQGIAYVLQAVLLFLLCAVFPPHVWYVGAAMAAGAVYLLAVNMRLSRKLTPELHFQKSWCSKSAVKEMVTAGIWNSLNNLGNVLNSGLDLLITNLMLDAAVLGEISIAKNLAAVCYLIVGKISGAFRPRQLILYAENESEKMTELYKTSMKITGTFCSFVICWFFLCGRDFLELWIPGQNIDFIFKASMIVLFSDIAIGVVQPLYYVFTLTKKVKLPCMITIAMGAANVLSMYLLLKHTSMGAYAVLVTTLVINCVHFVDTPLYAAYCLKLPLRTFYPVILRHCMAAGVCMAAVWKFGGLLPKAHSWAALVGKGVLAGIPILVILAAIMFSGREIRQVLERKK